MGSLRWFAVVCGGLRWFAVIRRSPYAAIKFVVKMHFKDAKEVAEQKVTLFF